MGRASRAKAQRRDGAVVKISQALVDVGEPMIARMVAEQSDAAVQQAAFQFVVHVWNAHVMAMPAWGQPQHLAALRATLMQQAEDGEIDALETFLQLSRRRRLPRFANDARAISHWELRRLPDGQINLYCEGREPGTEPQDLRNHDL